jgi:hypothetical protein
MLIEKSRFKKFFSRSIRTTLGLAMTVVQRWIIWAPREDRSYDATRLVEPLPRMIL